MLVVGGIFCICLFCICLFLHLKVWKLFENSLLNPVVSLSAPPTALHQIFVEYFIRSVNDYCF